VSINYDSGGKKRPLSDSIYRWYWRSSRYIGPWACV